MIKVFGVFSSSLMRVGVLAGCVGAAITAHAQQPAYTWEQIHDLFLRSNPMLRAQEQSIVSNRAAEITAGLRPNPTLQNDTTSSTVGIYQEFEIGGKRSARLGSAKLATQISQTDSADTRRTLTLSLRQAFVSALQAKSDLEFAHDNLANYQKTVDIDNEMFQHGEISRADFLRIQLQMMQFQTDLDDATLEMKAAKAALRGLLGAANLPPDFEVEGELKAQPFDKDLTELEKQAIENRPDLKSAETGRAKAAADLRLAKANAWPDPTIGLSYLHTGNEIGRPDWFQPFYPKGSSSNAMGIGISSIPIPIFNRNQGEVARAQSEQVRSQLLADASRAQVVQDVESAYAAFTSARERLHMYEQTYLGFAKELLDIEEFSFHKGGASILDFLDAQRTYRATQLAYRQQLASYLNALAQLQTAAGIDLTP
ncbi:TolC family protein [Occallatibacter riparius]|uniref:TolC family protein n=1 Tax=Occallatibacter riparius TaxID=1002689 RepID=A0A9J7BNL6_9BACT|nr:TolC family protein [Occallatibacter riparius]UWZ84484.1 TolC family protein [Occallatibacter riparius]